MRLHELDAQALDRLYREKSVSPVEVMQACLQRHHTTHHHINAVCHVDEAGALLAAHEAEARMLRSARLSVLDGVPFTVKDNLFVRGLPATWGSRLYRDFVAADDDMVVSRLRDAGACLLGKTNTPELALSGRTDNLLFGTTRNPVDLQLTPGGSSGGAVAATAAGVAPLAVATDAGGSTRLPASYTGLFGLRPSTGRIARTTGFPALAHDFQVIGLLARSIVDIEMLLRTVAGPDPRDRLSQALPDGRNRERAVRVRWVGAVECEPVDPAIRSELCRIAMSLQAAGVAVEEGVAPFDLARVRSVWGTLSAAGVARVVAARPDWQEAVTPDIRRVAEAGLSIAATDYVAALDELAAMRSAIDAQFGDDDFILTPTAAVLPWRADQPHVALVDGRPGSPRSASVFSTWVNACGLPAISLPLGMASAGIPIGVQLVARFGGDAHLLSFAQQLSDRCGTPAARFLDPETPAVRRLVEYRF